MLTVIINTTSPQTMTNSNISIRLAKSDDLKEMQRIFVDTITAVCSSDYDEQQIRVWVSGVNNTERWIKIMAEQYVIVAEKSDKILGYGTLNNERYIDLLYVHKDYQKQGIAQLLLDEIIKVARQLGQTQLNSDVSKTARPFFIKNGFIQLSEQTNIREGVELINYKMTKYL
jgi:putative acetyltransferase